MPLEQLGETAAAEKPLNFVFSFRHKLSVEVSDTSAVS